MLLTLREAANHFRMTTKSFSKFLKENERDPPLFAKSGRTYLFSQQDIERIYDAMKPCQKNRAASQERSHSLINTYKKLEKLTAR
ncbi:MAG TPA: hypothetical protein VIM56_00735 [Rhizomicrobium sp.]